MRPWPLTTPSPGMICCFHPEVLAAMRDELVDLLEGAGIEQARHALARGQLALRVMLLQPLFAAAELGEAFAFLQSFDRIHRTGNVLPRTELRIRRNSAVLRFA